jgi:hypothetical protein
MDYTIDLLELIGVEAECVSAITLTTSDSSYVSASRSPVYCSNVGGTCQLPFGTAIDVIYYMGIADTNGFLDKTEGFMYSSSVTDTS